LKRDTQETDWLKEDFERGSESWLQDHQFFGGHQGVTAGEINFEGNFDCGVEGKKS